MADLNLKSLASPSTSSANNNSYVYDIFINHRGPDCKETFARYLYETLSEHGLRVFLDQRELQEGESIWTPQIQSAIRTARVHIAIFSPRYAESAWCLNELVLMLESRATIIPVFYGVRPSELRWKQGETGLYARVLRMLPWVLCILCFTREESGAYARSLRTHEEKKTIDPQTRQKKPRYDSNTIRKWTETLAQLADISGFDKETYNGDERQLLKEVVEGVLKKVPREYHVAKYPIALDQKVEDFERKMLLQQQRGQTRVIGIVGLGGVGKTTLAKEIFNRQKSNYNRSCFLFDVRDKSLNSLQSMLLKDLVQLNEQINSIDEGKAKVRRYLPSCKALVILDDVDHIDQMDALLLSREDLLLSGSLILVTSRNKDVLTSWGIDESSIYSLTGLVPQHSKELFCSHAFGRPHPDVGFDEVVEEFVVACHGLPLSLKVLGALVRGKNDLNHWKEQLLKISEVLPSDIQRRLKISYNSLDEEEKHIFLDIACFFTGEDRDTTITILDGSGWRGCLGLRNLENRCLLEVDNENRIRMHHHLRDLGRSIAEKEPPDCLRRLWRPTDNLHNLSDESPVRGISMATNYGPEWRPQSSKSLAEPTWRLRLLTAEGDYVESILSIAQSPQLISLCWKKCPYFSLPSWIPTENLRVLKINGGELQTLWLHESQAPVQLRELHVLRGLSKIPMSIGKLKYLEKFVLSNCSYLQSLPDSFGNLTNLQSINLSQCSRLQMLPESFGNLTNLEHINLRSCTSLKILPDSFGRLRNLRHIDLSYYSNCALPDSFGNLTNLQHITLSHSHLKTLPDSFGGLTNLHRIDLSGSSKLERLPNSFGSLRCLQHIDLTIDPKLIMLPDSFGDLTKLQQIDLSCCFYLKMLPNSFGSLTNLQSINLSQCSRLQMLPESFGNLTNLQNINLTECSELPKLPISFRNLIQLKYLCLKSCQKLIISNETLGKINTLEYLDFSHCDEIEVLPPQVAHQLFLREMYLLCTRLKELPSAFGQLRNLKILHLRSKMLEMLPPSFSDLRSLEELELHLCHDGFKCFPSCIKMLSQLRILKIKEMKNLQLLKIEHFPPSETSADSREALEVSYPEDVCLNLQHVKIEDCNGLVEVGELPTTLITLELRGCGALRNVGGICGLYNLQKLNISGGINLEELPSIETLESLEWLATSRCVKLKSIQGLAQLTELRHLEVRDCSELEELPGVEHLCSLKWLNTMGCPKLQWGGEVAEKLRQRLKGFFIR